MAPLPRPVRKALRRHGVRGIAAIACAFSAVSSAEPTGLWIWDLALKVLLAYSVVQLGARSPRWATIVFATVAAAFSGVTLWGAAAWIAMLTATAVVLLSRRSRLVSAGVCAVALQALIRLPEFGFFGLSAGVSLCAILLLTTQGYRYSTSEVRRLVRFGTATAAGLSVVLGVVGVVATLPVRSDIARATSALDQVRSTVQAGDVIGAQRELDVAVRAIDSANDRLGGPASRALLLIPIAAQNQRSAALSIGEVARVAGHMRRVVGRTTQLIDQRGISERLAIVDGLTPDLRIATESISNAIDQIDRVEQASWLLPAVSQELRKASVQLSGVLPTAELLTQAAELAPEFLGVNGTQTYFVIFGTPAESRELGGLLGSWAALELSGGSMTVLSSGRIGELTEVSRASGASFAEAPEWFAVMSEPATWPQNLTSSPDFQVVATAVREAFQDVEFAPFDGVIYLDSLAMAEIISLGGSVDVSFQDAPLDGSNIDKFFREDQYRLSETRTVIFDELADVGAAAIADLLGSGLPPVRELADALTPMASAGRIQVARFDQADNEFLQAVGLLRTFGPKNDSDFVGLVQTNALPNKIDLYLTRAVSYSVEHADDGLLFATVQASLRSDIPEDPPRLTLGNPANGSVNRVLLSLYTPHELTEATIDGALIDYRSTQEFGLNRYLIDVTVPQNAERTVQFELLGIASPNDYSVEVWHQPLVNADEMQVDYRGPNGEISWIGPLLQNQVLSAK